MPVPVPPARDRRPPALLRPAALAGALGLLAACAGGGLHDAATAPVSLAPPAPAPADAGLPVDLAALGSVGPPTRQVASTGVVVDTAGFPEGGFVRVQRPGPGEDGFGPLTERLLESEAGFRDWLGAGGPSAIVRPVRHAAVPVLGWVGEIDDCRAVRAGYRAPGPSVGFTVEGFACGDRGERLVGFAESLSAPADVELRAAAATLDGATLSGVVRLSGGGGTVELRDRAGRIVCTGRVTGLGRPAGGRFDASCAGGAGSGAAAASPVAGGLSPEGGGWRGEGADGAGRRLVLTIG